MPVKDVDGGLVFGGFSPRTLTGRLPKNTETSVPFEFGGSNVRAYTYDGGIKQGSFDPIEGTGGSKKAGYIRRLVASRTPAPPFGIKKVAMPSPNLKLYSKYARELKRHPRKVAEHWSVGV
jgi:hypothetical protein